MNWRGCLRVNRFLVAVAAALPVLAASAKTVKVSDFGFDPEDSTRFLAAAIESDADEIIIDKAAGPWYSSPLSFRGLRNRTVRFEPGVEVRAKPGEFKSVKSNEACLFSFWACEGITLSGYGASIRMDREAYDKPPYVHSEHRHCLNLRGVTDFRIEGLTLAESGGDGLFIGGCYLEKRFKTSENVFMKDVVCDRNYRQGLSIISVSNLVAEGCSFSNTRGTPPQSGVDIEPNHPYEMICDMVFRNCRFDNNAGCGLEFCLGNLDSSSPPVTALLDKCGMLGNVMGFEYQQILGSGSDLPLGGKVVLRDCTIEKSTHAGIFVLDKPAESAELEFRNVKLVDCCTKSTNSADVTVYNRQASTKPPDGMMFLPLSVSRSIDRNWITPGVVDYTSTGVHAMSGTVTVACGDRSTVVRLDDAWRTARAPMPPGGPTRPRAPRFKCIAQVVDPSPGEMMPLEDVLLSGSHRFVFYVDSAREAKFRIKQTKLSSKRPFTMKRMLVREYTGSKITYLGCNLDDSEQELVFQARKRGYYTLDVAPGRQAVRFTAANVPVAVEVRDFPLKFGMTRTGNVYFRAPAPFSLMAGAGSYEKASVELANPSGEKVWSHPMLVDWQRYQGDAGDGLWTLSLRRPRSIHRVVQIDLTGVDGFFFLSKDRYWIGK